MRKTSSASIRHYYVSGVSCALPIATMALHHGVRLDGRIDVLDFGCGVGRQLLHLTRQFPRPRFSGCDVDSTLISFIKRHHPSVRAECTGFHPPLPYRDGEMDMVYSVSTFSHFNPESQAEWLRELFRITRPGGWCFLTTEGWTALRNLTEYFPESDISERLRRDGILYKEYSFIQEEANDGTLSPVVNRARGINGSYGATVMTPDYIRATWPHSGFRVVDVIEGIIDSRQDLVTLQRPAAS